MPKTNNWPRLQNVECCSEGNKWRCVPTERLKKHGSQCNAYALTGSWFGRRTKIFLAQLRTSTTEWTSGVPVEGPCTLTDGRGRGGGGHSEVPAGAREGKGAGQPQPAFCETRSNTPKREQLLDLGGKYIGVHWTLLSTFLNILNFS